MLAAVDISTGKVEPLAGPTAPVAAHALSPDGERLVFATQQDVENEQKGAFGPQADLWIMPSSGGTPEKLTRTTSRVFQLWWSVGDIYFSADIGGAHHDLWSLSADTPGHGHKLTSGQADEDMPSVSADGRWLVFTDNRENATALVVRDLHTGDDRTAVPTRLDFGVPTGTLRLDLVEKGSGQPLVARVAIQQQNQKFFAPPGALYRMAGDVEHFYADRHAELALPAGWYVVRAFRGTEYRRARLELQVSPGRTTTARVEIERWTDPSRRSLWSGESHIHANYGYGEWYNTPETMRLQIEGEGLNAANFVVANSDGDGVFDREFFRGAPDPASTPATSLYWNEELRATLWGHMTFLDLKHLVEPIFTGFRHTTNPWDVPTNGDVADHVHLQGGTTIYTHPSRSAADLYLGPYTAKGLPVDAALGKIDAMDISFGQYASAQLWYALLDCSLRIAASAGTDVFLNRVRSGLPGADRAYVRLDGAFSYQAWARGVREGRAFVTNGPMLELAVGDKRPGDTVKLPAAGEVLVRGVATWQSRLARVEVVYNGDVVATAPGGASTVTVDSRVRLDRSGWLSLRAYAPAGVQAHTSAIYVEVAGRPAGTRRAATYFLAWIERLEAKLRERDRLPSPAWKAHVQRQLDAARAVYRGIAARG